MDKINKQIKEKFGFKRVYNPESYELIKWAKKEKEIKKIRKIVDCAKRMEVNYRKRINIRTFEYIHTILLPKSDYKKDLGAYKRI